MSWLASTKWRLGGRAWIGVIFFLLAFAPGLWFPSLPVVMNAYGIGEKAPLVIIWISACMVLSPLFFGALADHKIPADRLLAILSASGAGFLYLAFYGLGKGWGAWPFILLLSVNALVSSPMWALSSSIALTHGKVPERAFPLYRFWGTIGWMVAGLTVSFLLKSDRTVLGGTVAAATRLVLAATCFFCLPSTPPLGSGAKTWRERFGLGALPDFSQPAKARSECVFLITAFLLGVTLTAFLLYTPRHLDDLGARWPTALMTIGQISEIGTILGLGVFTEKFKLKHLLAASLLFCILRYSLFAAGEIAESLTLVVTGIFLHGFCYILFIVVGQLYMARRAVPGTRSQGQALLALLFSGFGTMLGAYLSGIAHAYFVTEGNGGWSVFWQTHLVACGLLLIFFWRGFRIHQRTTEMTAHLPNQS